MSTDCQPPAASTTAAIEVSPPFSKRRLDRIDEPAAVAVVLHQVVIDPEWLREERPRLGGRLGGRPA